MHYNGCLMNTAFPFVTKKCHISLLILQSIFDRHSYLEYTFLDKNINETFVNNNTSASVKIIVDEIRTLNSIRLEFEIFRIRHR